MPVFQVSERYSASRPRLLRMLADTATSGACRATAYLRPETARSPEGPPAEYLTALPEAGGLRGELAELVQLLGETDTGLALFWCGDRVTAVVPPFPLDVDSLSGGVDTSPLERLLARELTVGIVLLRLGRYSLGVLRGEELLASKSGTRYVKARHRAGGSSQRRFERSRERLVRELFDKVCEVASDVFTPFDGRIDYLMMGGERHTLGAFVRRCLFVKQLGPMTLTRTLDVGRPGRAALERMPQEVWKSRVIELTREEGA